MYENIILSKFAVSKSGLRPPPCFQILLFDGIDVHVGYFMGGTIGTKADFIKIYNTIPTIILQNKVCVAVCKRSVRETPVIVGLRNGAFTSQ